MTQIQDPIEIIHNEPFMNSINSNLNFMNQMNLPQMMPQPLNMPINNNYQMSLPYQVQNNAPNPQNNDQSNYIIFKINLINYYRKT